MCNAKQYQIHSLSQDQYKPAIYGIKYENGEWYAIDKYENKLDSNIPYVANMINNIRTIQEELMSLSQEGSGEN